MKFTSTFLSFSLLCFVSFHLCSANNLITSQQSLRYGQTLVSPGNNFILGFFNTGKSKNSYIGIWYANYGTQTVVWVANRENPLLDTNGTLTISQDGNLVLLDGLNQTVWSTNITSSVKNLTAELLDTSNFILREGSSEGKGVKTIWESFNNPTDTLMPFMKMTVNLDQEMSFPIRSWRSEDDPAPGNYALTLETKNLPTQALLYNGSEKYWTSGLWNGAKFVGIHDMQSVNQNGFDIFTDTQERKMYITFDLKNMITRFTLDHLGIFKQVTWDPRSRLWQNGVIINGNICDRYRRCGSFAVCDSSKTTICECLRGYQPKNFEEWRKGNWSNGCVRKVKLQCETEARGTSFESGRQDGFLKLTGLKLPDFPYWYEYDPLNGSLCVEYCSRNCSCIAYAFESGIGCMFWDRDLVDMQKFESEGSELFIKMVYSELDSPVRGLGNNSWNEDNKGKRRMPTMIIVLIVILSVFLPCSCLCVFYFGMKKKRRSKDRPEDFHGEGHRYSSRVSMLNGISGGEIPELLVFDMGRILAATENFNPMNKIGRGGFGSVYKGKLDDGQEIAVKRLSASSGQGSIEYKNEVILISRLQHRNLVKLLGCCIEREEKMLIYEYLPNKSLDLFLFDPEKCKALDWPKRISIVEGIARGLVYLHRDSRLKIIHRDLKASNILLDGELNPKISDFGMARIFGSGQTPANTDRVVGTYGYMSPEYAMEGRFSEKTDVFSFGVLLLEIITGERNTRCYKHRQTLNLLGYVWQLWNEGKTMDLLDPSLHESYVVSEVKRCIHVGLLCVQEDEDARPTMASIVLMLRNESVTLPMASKPGFSLRNAENRVSSSNTFGIYQTNFTSITEIEGR